MKRKSKHDLEDLDSVIQALALATTGMISACKSVLRCLELYELRSPAERQLDAARRMLTHHAGKIPATVEQSFEFLRTASSRQSWCSTMVQIGTDTNLPVLARYIRTTMRRLSKRGKLLQLVLLRSGSEWDLYGLVCLPDGAPSNPNAGRSYGF